MPGTEATCESCIITANRPLERPLLESVPASALPAPSSNGSCDDTTPALPMAPPCNSKLWGGSMLSYWASPFRLFELRITFALSNMFVILLKLQKLNSFSAYALYVDDVERSADLFNTSEATMGASDMNSSAALGGELSSLCAG